MALEDYYFIPLKADSEIKPFKCKDDDLNGFLFEDAQKYLTDLMAVTYLLEDLSKGKTGFDFLSIKDEKDKTRSMYYDLKRFLDNGE